jgi:hypothetical protein
MHKKGSTVTTTCSHEGKAYFNNVGLTLFSLHQWLFHRSKVRPRCHSRGRITFLGRAGKEIELKLAEYVVWAERKLGEMLKAAKAAGQITHFHGNRHTKKVINDDDNLVVPLSDAGISPNLSSRVQRPLTVINGDDNRPVKLADAAVRN